jgi:hypothetical protein
MNWETPMFATLGGILCFAITGTVYLLIKYRESPLIVNRSLTSVLLQIGAEAMMGILGCFKNAYAEHVNCGIGILLVNIMVLIQMTFLVERCVLLLCNFYASVQARELAKMQSTSGDQKSDAKMKWLLSNRHYFSFGPFSVLKRITYAVVTLEFLIPLFQIILDTKQRGQSTANTEGCAELQKDINAFSNALFGIVIISLVECGRRITRIQENFYIKQEFRNMIIVAFIVVPWLALGYIPSISQNVHSDIGYYFLFPLLGIVISGTNVAFAAKRESEHQSTHNETRSPSIGASSEIGSEERGNARPEKKHRTQKQHLHDVMHNEVLREAFEKFMVQEFCVENVYFLFAVENFERQAAMPQDDSSSKQLRILAQDIFHRFCDLDSKLCVNISFKARNELTSHLSGSNGDDTLLRADLFDQSKEEIITLICEDPFRRFVRNDLYTAAKSTSIPPVVMAV